MTLTDLLTLLSMLRATIYTRITGDAGMKRQRLALVPVGAVGLDELLSLMSQYVVDFVSEADTFIRGGDAEKELAELVGSARINAYELFSRFRLHATAKQGNDGFSFVRRDDAADFVQHVSSAIAPLVSTQDARPGLPSHIYCAGPVFVENWATFDKREMFSFEGWETQTEKMTKRLFMQLRDIDKERKLPAALRIPASNLFRLLAREKPGAANEFITIKELKSPNTWVVVPVAYSQFMAPKREQDNRAHYVEEPEVWRQGLGRVLATNDSVMPPIPKYEEFPWAAAVGPVNPLRLDIVFDDRYFMASNELNLLNTILLAEQD